MAAKRTDEEEDKDQEEEEEKTPEQIAAEKEQIEKEKKEKAQQERLNKVALDAGPEGRIKKEQRGSEKSLLDLKTGSKQFLSDFQKEMKEAGEKGEGIEGLTLAIAALLSATGGITGLAVTQATKFIYHEAQKAHAQKQYSEIEPSINRLQTAMDKRDKTLKGIEKLEAKILKEGDPDGSLQEKLDYKKEKLGAYASAIAANRDRIATLSDLKLSKQSNTAQEKIKQADELVNRYQAETVSAGEAKKFFSSALDSNLARQKNAPPNELTNLQKEEKNYRNEIKRMDRIEKNADKKLREQQKISDKMSAEERSIQERMGSVKGTLTDTASPEAELAAAKRDLNDAKSAKASNEKALEAAKEKAISLENESPNSPDEVKQQIAADLKDNLKNQRDLEKAIAKQDKVIGALEERVGKAENLLSREQERQSKIAAKLSNKPEDIAKEEDVLDQDKTTETAAQKKAKEAKELEEAAEEERAKELEDENAFEQGVEGNETKDNIKADEKNKPKSEKEESEPEEKATKSAKKKEKTPEELAKEKQQAHINEKANKVGPEGKIDKHRLGLQQTKSDLTQNLKELSEFPKLSDDGAAAAGQAFAWLLMLVAGGAGMGLGQGLKMLNHGVQGTLAEKQYNQVKPSLDQLSNAVEKRDQTQSKVNELEANKEKLSAQRAELSAKGHYTGNVDDKINAIDKKLDYQKEKLAAYDNAVENNRRHVEIIAKARVNAYSAQGDPEEAKQAAIASKEAFKNDMEQARKEKEGYQESLNENKAKQDELKNQLKIPTLAPEEKKALEQDLEIFKDKQKDLEELKQGASEREKQAEKDMKGEDKKILEIERMSKVLSPEKEHEQAVKALQNVQEERAKVKEALKADKAAEKELKQAIKDNKSEQDKIKDPNSDDLNKLKGQEEVLNAQLKDNQAGQKDKEKLAGDLQGKEKDAKGRLDKANEMISLMGTKDNTQQNASVVYPGDSFQRLRAQKQAMQQKTEPSSSAGQDSKPSASSSMTSEPKPSVEIDENITVGESDEKEQLLERSFKKAGSMIQDVFTKALEPQKEAQDKPSIVRGKPFPETPKLGPTPWEMDGAPKPSAKTDKAAEPLKKADSMQKPELGISDEMTSKIRGGVTLILSSMNNKADDNNTGKELENKLKLFSDLFNKIDHLDQAKNDPDGGNKPSAKSGLQSQGQDGMKNMSADGMGGGEGLAGEATMGMEAGDLEKLQSDKMEDKGEVAGAAVGYSMGGPIGAKAGRMVGKELGKKMDGMKNSDSMDFSKEMLNAMGNEEGGKQSSEEMGIEELFARLSSTIDNLTRSGLSSALEKPGAGDDKKVASDAFNVGKGNSSITPSADTASKENSSLKKKAQGSETPKPEPTSEPNKEVKSTPSSSNRMSKP